MICDKTITKEEYKYSFDKFNKALCRYHQKKELEKKSRVKKTQVKPKRPYIKKSKSTPHARMLHNELTRLGIKNTLEAEDGYKSVDISIEWAGINIEVDGAHHVFNSKQMYKDLMRDSWSYENGIKTLRLRNDDIEKDVRGIAETIAKVARRRYKEKNDY